MIYRRQKNYSTKIQKDVEQESISTQEQQVFSPRKCIKKKFFKQKSELCWKFMQNGQCPYKLKCKFAHGIHQLTKSLNVNVKYRTKKCLAYFNNVECHFGIRCNFLHNQKDQRVDNKWKQVKKNYRSIFYEVKTESKICNTLGNQK